jgi:signal transduction histidine kinase/DNA-binding response OmpR family regulator/ligand-binding sensor domain-containing protein
MKEPVRYCTLLAFLIFMLLANLLHAQKANISFQHFSPKQGMSSFEISNIYQDHKGYLWFGAGKGLDKYDGYNFTSYFPADSINFTSSSNGSISEDSEGNLWIGNYNGGLEKLDPETKTFTHYLPDPRYPASEWCNIVLAVYVDKNDVIWVGTGNGFYKFDKNNKTFIYFKHDENDSLSLGHSVVNAICEDKSGTLWIATAGGLDRFDKETNKFYHYWYHPNNKFNERKTAIYWLNAIAEDDEGVLWLGAAGGLVKFDIKTKTFTSYIHDPQNPLSQVVLSICDNGRGELWLASNFGIDVFNKRTKTFSTYIHDPKDPASLSRNGITSILLDRSGSIWISTDMLGVNKFDLPDLSFKKYVYKPSQKGGLSNDRVWNIFQKDNGKLLLCTSKGFEIFDPDNETFSTPSYNFNANYNVIFQDTSGNIFVGPWAVGGLYKLNSKNQWMSCIDSFKVKKSSNSIESLTSIYTGSNNQHWIGTAGGYLYLFNPSFSKKKLIAYIKKYPQTIYEDTYGLVWFGGLGTGLFCYDSSLDSVIFCTNGFPPNESFLHFCLDKSGTLWFSSNRNLYKYNRAANKFTAVFEKAKFIGQPLEDDHGNLWMCTSKGVIKFNTHTDQFKYYYTFSTEINFYSASACRTNNGEMYFGGENGFIRFHPDSIKENTYIPPVVITSFQKFEKPFPFRKEVKLSYSDNFISFEFAVLSFINSEENQYAYKMEGLDKDWIYCGTRRYASYPNIAPGEYFFRVKGSTSSLVWNEAGTSLKIIINPPWWKTTWAYIFYILLILSILYYTWRLQLRRMRMKHEFEMSTFEAEKLREIDKIKSRFFTNISHEFRTPLTLILGPAQQLMERIKDNKAKEELDLIHRSAKKLNRLVDELLDISKIEAGEMKLKTCPLNLVTVVNELAFPFYSLAESKKITFKFKSDVNEIITYIDKDKFDKILTNVLSNAFKFTPEGGKVELGISCKEKNVEIIINDTGVGIPKAHIDRIFDRFYQVDGSHTREHEGTGIGLTLTKELIELHKGKIEVESEESKGTIFRLIFPLGKDHLRPEEICNKEDLKDLEREKVIVERDDFIERKEKHFADIESLQKESRPSLLIVEDNSDVRKYISSILENHYHIIEAVDGEEGLDRSFNHIPDLIISDIMMPKLDGFQLCGKLKTDSRTSHIPIIVLTAKATMNDKINGLQIGADDYLIKPFEAAELQARIKNLLEQRKRLHEHFHKYGLVEIEEQNMTSLDQKFIQKSIEVINNNLSDTNLNVEFLSRHLSISKSVLNKKLSALTGDTPAELIKRIRLSKAAKLIERSTGNISEIALEVGFSNPAYFAECFKKQFGISPSQYHNHSGNS